MTTNGTLTPEEAALAAEFAMGLLTGPERAAFELRLRSDPVLLGEVQDWHEHLAKLTDGIQKRPRARVKRHLMRRLYGTAPWVTRAWQGLGLAGLALGAAMAAVVAFLPEPPQTLYAAEVVAEDNSLRVLAVFDGETLRLTRTDGAPRAGRVLELWLIAPESAPVSLGVLPDSAGDRRTVAAPLRPLFMAGTLAVSDEPPGGSPTGQPTGDVLAIGPLTEL